MTEETAIKIAEALESIGADVKIFIILFACFSLVSWIITCINNVGGKR